MTGVQTCALPIFTPCIPASWDGVTIDYRFGGSSYAITIVNPDGVSTGARLVELDGAPCLDGEIELRDDGTEHFVRVTMGQTDAIAVEANG